MSPSVMVPLVSLRILEWRSSQTPRARIESLSRRVLIPILALVAVACSGEPKATPGAFGDDPAAVKQSEGGHFEITLYSSPTAVPVRGENHVRIAVDDTGDDTVALTPSLVTFMPAMGHGSGVLPELSEVQGQTYTFEDVVLNMPGRWELRLTLDGENSDGSMAVDNAVFEFDVD